ncbi:hypothetical protein RRG08_011166 [Elysia crispata]|uniref:Uncharacterized protein n=1 Tax=Elysia crispata TaxID=231223 RepID=A0AAE1DRM9_9GAST|nr:hypothetical protein RRG08_011166 [Elysia crispata]
MCAVLCLMPYQEGEPSQAPASPPQNQQHPKTTSTTTPHSPSQPFPHPLPVHFHQTSLFTHRPTATIAKLPNFPVPENRRYPKAQGHGQKQYASCSLRRNFPSMNYRIGQVAGNSLRLFPKLEFQIGAPKSGLAMFVRWELSHCSSQNDLPSASLKP